jgi:hypothetical protein
MSLSSQIKIINPLCNNDRIIADLNEAYQRMIRVHYTGNVTTYFEHLFHSLHGTSSNFLIDSECLSIFKLFEEVMVNSHYFNGPKKVHLDSLRRIPRGGAVYQLELMSIFASYHYLTAVISPDLTFVDIYQSYGSSFRFNHSRISINSFEKGIDNLKKVNILIEQLTRSTRYTLSSKKKTNILIKVILSLLEIESTLNNIPLRTYIQTLKTHAMNDEEFGNDYDEETYYILNKILEKYHSLNGVLDAMVLEILISNIELGKMRKSHIVKVNEYTPKTIGSPLSSSSTSTSSSKGKSKKNKRSKQIKKSRKHRMYS